MKNIVEIFNIKQFTPTGHRGAPQEFPENSIESYKRAVEIFPHILLETDIRVTRDGRFILFHDDILDHHTDGKGPVKNHILEEIKKMDAGYNISFDGGKTYPFRGKGYRLALLKDALSLFNDTLFSIDLKDESFDTALEAIELIKRCNAFDRVIIGSFHSKIIKGLRDKYPALVTSFSMTEVAKFLMLQKLGLSRFYRKKDKALFIPEYSWLHGSELNKEKWFQGIHIVTQRFIKAAHRKGIPVFIWTINDSLNMKRLIDWGVNGIITDFPDKLKIVMESKSD